MYALKHSHGPRDTEEELEELEVALALELVPRVVRTDQLA